MMGEWVGGDYTIWIHYLIITLGMSLSFMTTILATTYSFGIITLQKLSYVFQRETAVSIWEQREEKNNN